MKQDEYSTARPTLEHCSNRNPTVESRWALPKIQNRGPTNLIESFQARAIKSEVRPTSMQLTKCQRDYRSAFAVVLDLFYNRIYCNEYFQLATCICLSWIFTIFDWSMCIFDLQVASGQLKRAANLLTVIGLTTMHAVCCITFMLYPFFYTLSHHKI